MTIVPLSEGSFTIDQTKAFVPFNKATDDLQQRPTGSLLVEIQPFAVITSKDIIILDCGLGFSDNSDVLQIHKNLVDHDIDPMSVTKVLLTHLHKDHAGGISKHDKQLHQRFLSFPNATYYVHEKELAFASQKQNASYLPEQFETLKFSDKLVLLKEETGVIDGYIDYELTCAHSAFHQVFWIRENNQTLFFGGDDAPQHQQMKSRFVAKYDFDGKKASALRSMWWERGQTEGWTFLFYHDIQTPVVSFEKQQ
jgi:glyoxylase-like metal-dependent hydrolase (beta-lactamase superfamily II)